MICGLAVGGDGRKSALNHIQFKPQSAGAE